MKTFKYELLLVCLFFVGCAVVHERVEREEERNKPPVTVESEFKGKWNRADWDAYLRNAILQHGLLNLKPRDWNNFINVWPLTEKSRMKFWGNILVAMARYESSWTPSRKYRESFGVTSRGLFQISVPSVNQTRYGCNVKNEQDLHKASVNIDCAVKVFAYWIKTDGVIRGRVGSSWRGPARYWSVIRGVSSTHTKKAYAAIKSANK